MFANTAVPSGRIASCVKRQQPEDVHIYEKNFHPDIAGPLVVTADVNRKKAKCVLVGTFTCPTGGVGEDVEEKVEEEAKEDAVILQFEDPEGGKQKRMLR